MSSTFFEKFKQQTTLPACSETLKISAIDMHTGGEPLRVIIDGYPEIQAESLLDYRRQLKNDFDYLRTALMFEPRGHADMYGCIVLPPFDPAADCSVIFMHNEGYSSMCGHAIIAIMTLAMKMNWVEIDKGQASMKIEAPCGLIVAQGELKDGKIRATFECVPSFVSALNQQVFVPSLNTMVNFDLAYGGAFYAYVNAKELGISLSVENNRQLIDLGSEIKQMIVASELAVEHPFENDLSFLYGTIFIGDAQTIGVDSRNVCVFADGEVDRSPTGSGVAGRVAIHYARGEIGLNESMKIESIVGSVFDVEVLRALKYAEHAAIIAKVSGAAYICGINQLLIQPDDPFKQGFLIR